MVKPNFALYTAAAATTAIAGMMHLMLGPGIVGFNVNQGILFVVGGIAQVFWIIPVIRKWGIPWYTVGAGGTAVFDAIFFITRVPGNPITGRGGGINSLALVSETCEVAFIALALGIIAYDIRMKKRPVEKKAGKSRKAIPILAGIVIVLILSGLFVLPMTMARPMGGPPGQRPPGQSGAPQEQKPTGTAINPASIMPLLVKA